MNVWNQLDLDTMKMRERIIELTEEFDSNQKNKIGDYNQKLNKFLNRKLKKESDLLIKRQVFLTLFSLEISKSKGL
jgi:hypothetical protein